MFYQIAIDGCGGSGKSSVSTLLAKKLNFVHLNSGVFYRAVTFLWLQKEKCEIQELLDSLNSSKELSFRGKSVFFKEQKLTHELFQPEIAQNICSLSGIQEIRQYINEKIKQYIENKDVVVEGRDIGTCVLPNAHLKIFLSADLKTRALRRVNQIYQEVTDEHVQNVMKEIAARDEQDESREIAPLRKAQDAMEIMTDNLTLEQVVNEIYEIFNEQNNWEEYNGW